MTGSLEIFARLSELNVGDAVKLDGGFDCGIDGKTLSVDEDDRGLFVACDEGRHYLDGQLADDGDRLVGVYRVEGETVEVWSTQTPALNGTLMVVSTVAEADSFELVIADCLPDDDDEGEEPGAMCKRAFAKASTSVDLIRQVAIKMSGSDDRADFERSYPIEQKKALLGTAREIIELVRGSSVEGPLPELGLASKASADERSNNWKLNVAESYVGTLSPNGGPGGSPELVDAIPLSEYLAHLEGKRS